MTKAPIQRLQASLLSLLLVAPALLAQVDRIEIRQRQVVADGEPFGVVGPYEKLVGTVYFSLDPDDLGNAQVTDLERAPRDGGRVRYSADLYVLRPVDPGRGNGTLLFEVSNRGGKAQVRYFNRGAERSADPTRRQDFGDGFLMRRGFTLAWLGWQFDVPESRGLGLSAPHASGLEGRVRADQVFDAPAQVLPLGHRGHLAYPVSDPQDPRNVLTVREERLGPRRTLPRQSWRFARLDGDRVVADPRSVYLEGGFEKGKIYEVVYVARDPAIVGLGLTAIRDFVSHVKYHPQAPVQVRRAVGFGISQTGRFLRHFLYQGFNVDLEERGVFDGVWAHTAGGGRGSFNHRFAQPSRDGHAFSAFFFPTDLFPFSDAPQTDPETHLTQGLLDRLRGTPQAPRIFYTNTSYEYWGRAASPIHTTVEGEGDLEPPPGVRIYHLAGTQHFTDAFPPRRASTLYPANPSNVGWAMRALLVAMEDWITRDAAPPESRYPRIDQGTLVRPQELDFPAPPGVTVARKVHEAYRMNYGGRFRSQGIIDQQPPEVGKPFPILVPQVSKDDGNETGGLRLPEIAVPLATYTPWNFRAPELGAASELAPFRGSFFPFAVDAAERRSTNDPRLSVAERYPSRNDYLARYTRVALDLVRRRYLLAEDLPEMIAHAEELWDLVVGGQ